MMYLRIYRVNCHLDESEARLSNCNHCGSKKWNILGDSDTGYILTQDDKNKYCLTRDGITAKIVLCDDTFTTLSLQCK
jgi:hypothetical protein